MTMVDMDSGLTLQRHGSPEGQGSCHHRKVRVDARNGEAGGMIAGK